MTLRDVTPAMLADGRHRMDPVVARRAQHIVEENQRVLATVAAMEAGDLAAIGDLFAAGHASLRDLFEISSPELDALVEIAVERPRRRRGPDDRRRIRWLHREPRPT